MILSVDIIRAMKDAGWKHPSLLPVPGQAGQIRPQAGRDAASHVRLGSPHEFMPASTMTEEAAVARVAPAWTSRAQSWLLAPFMTEAARKDVHEERCVDGAIRQWRRRLPQAIRQMKTTLMPRTLPAAGIKPGPLSPFNKFTSHGER